MSRHFTKIAVIDTEYEIDDGGLPNLPCMVVYLLDANLQLVKVVCYWRGEFPTKSPFDDETLVVAFSAWAELACFMQPSPNWKFPRVEKFSLSRELVSRNQQHFAAARSGQ